MFVLLMVSPVVAQLLSCKGDFHVSFVELLLLLQTFSFLNSQHPERQRAHHGFSLITEI